MWKLLVAFLIFGALATGMMILINFNQMTYQINVRPWEDPMLLPPEGSVHTEADADYLYNRAEARVELINPVPLNEDSFRRGRVSYRQYCLACHGANLDNFGPVGPSLPWAKGKDKVGLDSAAVAAFPDGELFWIIRNRLNAHPPIGKSMTKKQIWDTVNYLRFKQEETARYNQ